MAALKQNEKKSVLLSRFDQLITMSDVTQEGLRRFDADVKIPFSRQRFVIRLCPELLDISNSPKATTLKLCSIMLVHSLSI